MTHFFCFVFFFFKQKTAYEMRISDWSSDVCSSDLMLQHLADAGLSKYDMPEFFITMEAFPLTPSGKVLKREMVEQIRSGVLTPMPTRFRAEPLRKEA